MLALAPPLRRFGAGHSVQALQQRQLAGQQLARAPPNGATCRAFFNFNKGRAESTVSLTRDDFGAQEVEDYFNYMGMLASEGTYDRMEAMLASEEERKGLYRIDAAYSGGQAPVDLLLLMSCSENDAPKVEELLAAGANPRVKDLNGKSPLELCTKEEIKGMVERALNRTP